MEHTSCLISGSVKLKPLKGYERHYLVKSYPLGFVFCSEIPTEDELIAHYQKYSRIDYLSPITVKRYEEILDAFEPFRSTGNLLDIGCGTGLFLESALKRGWKVYGTEYTDNAIEIGRSKGFIMNKGKLNTSWYQPGMFDVITSFEVIEHINNPVEEVQNIHFLLRKKGLFYFTTPNFNAIERRMLKADYNVIEYPEHLCYYTPHTVNFLLSKNGFKKKKLTTTGVSLTRLRTSKDLKEGKQMSQSLISASSSDEIVRNKLESNWLGQAVKQSINFFLNLFGLGNSLKGWYIKK
ncbi:MAG: class I SAM-dependent methyltransferase [Chitinophagaceae bacterium]